MSNVKCCLQLSNFFCARSTLCCFSLSIFGKYAYLCSRLFVLKTLIVLSLPITKLVCALNNLNMNRLRRRRYLYNRYCYQMIAYWNNIHGRPQPPQAFVVAPKGSYIEDMASGCGIWMVTNYNNKDILFVPKYLCICFTAQPGHTLNPYYVMFFFLWCEVEWSRCEHRNVLLAAS